jgi:hypothetical protein
MPLQLHNLDDRRYADLVEEARRLIPVYDPAWTNHNPTDPGITLVELFAYLTEMLLYRLDRVTAENQRKFLKLLNGPDWAPGTDLTEDIRTTVLAVRERERAVTAADFERLAIDSFNRLDAADPANLPSGVSKVARAACVPSRNLERGTEATRTAYAPAHVSLIVLPEDADALQPPSLQKAALWGYLDERRTLTTRHHVGGPYYAPIHAEIVVASVSGALISAVSGRIIERLAHFLDPFVGGTDDSGWPFGRDVYASELYEQIEAIEGVDFVTDLMLFSDCLPADQQCAAAAALWHAEGDLIGMALAPHHLPLARFAVTDVVIAPHTSFLPAQIAVTLTSSGTADAAALKRQAKAAVRAFFHPLHQGPGPGTAADTDLTLADLKSVLDGIPDVTAVALALHADATRLLVEDGEVVGLHAEAGEVVNWQCQVTVTMTGAQ